MGGCDREGCDPIAGATAFETGAHTVAHATRCGSSRSRPVYPGAGHRPDYVLAEAGSESRVLHADPHSGHTVMLSASAGHPRMS